MWHMTRHLNTPHTRTRRFCTVMFAAECGRYVTISSIQLQFPTSFVSTNCKCIVAMGKLIRYMFILILLHVVFFFNWIQSCEFKWQIWENGEHKRLSENETLSIMLYFTKTNCFTLKDIRIDIGKDRNDNILCIILFEQDTACTQTDGSDFCRCEGNSGTYIISRKMKRNDSGLWKFMAMIDGNVNATYEINVTVTYPANVFRVEVDGQDVHSSYTLIRNRNASIVCIWENGSPSVIAHLLDQNRKILGNETNKNISYTYVASGCKQNTIMTCEASGSSRNISISLLTLCPPMFVDASPNLVLSKNTFTVRVQAHTTSITECRLYRQTNSSRTSEREDECHQVSKTRVENMTCQTKNTSVTFYSERSLEDDYEGKHCSCGLEGTVPDLNFTLQLLNFKEQDNGEWVLVLSSPGGCNTTSFNLHLSVINTVTGNEETWYHLILAVTMASIILLAVLIIKFSLKKNGKMVSGFWKRQKQNKSVEYRSPTDHQIHGGITMVVNGMYEASEECVSPTAFSSNVGVHRSEGTVVGDNDIYARVMKKTQGQQEDSDLNTEQEGIQSFNNPFYEVVSAKKDMETPKTVKDAIEEVIEYVNPFYGIKNCILDDKIINSDPKRNVSSLDGNGETCFTISTDTYNLSDNINECSQPPVLHIQNLAEAKHNTYMGVSIQRQDARVFQRSAQPLVKVQE